MPLGGIEGHELIPKRLEHRPGPGFTPRAWDLRCSCGEWRETGRGDNRWTAERFAMHLAEVGQRQEEPSDS
jgi:hypothetical protein